MPKTNSFQRVSVGKATTDETVTTAATFNTAFWANAAFTVWATITARETADSDEVASYVRAASFKRDGDVLSLVGSVATPLTAESTGGWDATLDASGDDIRVRVTGAAATAIKWLTELEIQVNDESPYTVS